MKRESRQRIISPDDGLLTLHVFASDYPRLLSWCLVQWCKVHGADEWTADAVTLKGEDAQHFENFEGIMTPFRRPSARRKHLSASAASEFVRPTELWQLTVASLAALERFFPEGLFTYELDADGWFEDLILFRKGQLMLGVVSHEREGVLRVTVEERAQLEREGFVYQNHGVYVGY